jgi:hypothetical protein
MRKWDTSWATKSGRQVLPKASRLDEGLKAAIYVHVYNGIEVNLLLTVVPLVCHVMKDWADI